MYLCFFMFVGLCVCVYIIYQQYWWIVELDIKLTKYQKTIEKIEHEQAEAEWADIAERARDSRSATPEEQKFLGEDAIVVDVPIPIPQNEPTASVFDSDPHPGNPQYPG